MRKAFRLSAFLAALALAGPAAAQSLADFERIDANKDGAMSAAEFEAARRRDFDAADIDKDGRLSREEFVRPRGAGPDLVQLRGRRFAEIDTDRTQSVSWDEYLAHGRRQFAALDRDRDGRVTRSEFESALAGRAPPAGGQAAEPPPIERPRRLGPLPPADDRESRAAFARIDRDRDGAIAPGELDAARLESFRQMDTDRDGRLSRQEIVAAQGEAAAARFAELDANRDGFVSRPEFLAAGRAMFRAADGNGDGKLSYAEFARAGTR